MSLPNNPYKRILLKISGETLMGSQHFGISQEACEQLAKSIDKMRNSGLQVAVVIGGGNIFRGIHLENLGLERTPADQMGMLATMINGIALQQALGQINCKAIVMSSLSCPGLVDNFDLRRAIDHLENENVIIFVGGTGNPYFTTDTAAALRASEIQADIILKATKVDGVYDKDPMIYQDAKKFETLTYSKALSDNLKVMDATAIAMCRN
ncbi:uridylate kinase, partial [Waddlia chondrophila 2032/99]